MVSDARALRREVERVERGVGRRYPASLKSRITAYARSRRSEGASWSAIVAEIGGPRYETLTRWCAVDEGSDDDAHVGALVPVEIVAPATRDMMIAVVSPNGWRLEGLELSDAVAILRTLG